MRPKQMRFISKEAVRCMEKKQQYKASKQVKKYKKINDINQT